MMKKIDSMDIPVNAFIRVARVEGELVERCMIILRAENGKEYTLMFDDELNDGLIDLTVCDIPSKENKV